MKSPCIFISYSWENDKHKEWVRRLAEELVKKGVDVRLDQWHVAPGESFTQFMEQEVANADYVLAICTPVFASKSNERKGGVGYEQQIVSGRLVTGAPRSKFIPIIRRGKFELGPDCAVPTHFAGVSAIDMTDNKAFSKNIEELLRAVFSRPIYVPPKKGNPPQFIVEKDSSSEGLKIQGTTTNKLHQLNEEPIFLSCFVKDRINRKINLTFSVLTTEVTLIKASNSIMVNELDKCVEEFERGSISYEKQCDLSDTLSKLLLPDEVGSVLHSMKRRPLVVLQDTHTPPIPWEMIRIYDWIPSLEAGISRRYVHDSLHLQKCLTPYKDNSSKKLNFKVLLVNNPTEDLSGAEAETQRIEIVINELPGAAVFRLDRADASKTSILALLRSREYNVLHFAGHLFSDPTDILRSGLLCRGGEILSALDLADVAECIPLVFFHSCEVGRVRLSRNTYLPKIQERFRCIELLGMSIVHSGVSNFLGTYWPAGDVEGALFMEIFHRELANGSSVGHAVTIGRREIRKRRSIDWVSYVQYDSANNR